MKRVLALLILAACLMTAVACSAEPLPTMTAEELMDKAMAKMTACPAYEAEMLYEITLTDTLGEQSTVRVTNSYKISERGFVLSFSNTVLTAEGETTYSLTQCITYCDNMLYAKMTMDEETVVKQKEYAEDLSLPQDPLEVFSFLTPEVLAQATVTCGTVDWTITVPVSALEGEPSDPAAAGSDDVVTIVISRLYTIKSISFSIEEDGQTATFRSSFFSFGRDRVSPPSDAEDYEEAPAF